MPTSDQQEHEGADQKPSLAQRVHAATGDRDAEARALADEVPEADPDEAKAAVLRARGEAGREAPATAEDLPTPADVEAVHEERAAGT